VESENSRALAGIEARPKSRRGWMIASALCAFALASVAHSGVVQSAWAALIGDQLPAPGKPVAADQGKLSEHDIEWVMKQPPQEQAEFLLSSTINHDQGATDLIEKLVAGWHGYLHPTKRFDDLQMTALYSNDLRVRAAAIEINLAVYNLSKTDETADRLIHSAEQRASNRPFATWELGMLANRGVETEHIHEVLTGYIHDDNEKTRYWAVEGLAHIGTDDTIKDFLDVLRNDPSLDVKERAGCSLAKSGMLTREQRMGAVPGLLELTDDPALDATTRSWVYQALREITDVNLPNDPATWRNWYSENGAERKHEFSEGEKWSVLGNS
jgi:HEAT repeats